MAVMRLRQGRTLENRSSSYPTPHRKLATKYVPTTTHILDIPTALPISVLSYNLTSTVFSFLAGNGKERVQNGSKVTETLLHLGQMTVDLSSP